MILSAADGMPSLAAKVVDRYLQAKSTINLEPRSFSVGSVQVVVEDASVSEADLDKYAAVLNRVRGLLKAKGFGRAWYGNIYIQCKGCGGINTNDHGATGGWYEHGRDAIVLFERPTARIIVQLLVHEIGHRVWYKLLKSDQRKRFTSLVKTHTVPRPAPVEDHTPIKFFSHSDLAASQRNIAGELKTALGMLQDSGLEDQLFLLTDAAFDIKWNGLYDDLGEGVEHLADSIANERDETVARLSEVPRDLDLIRGKIKAIARYGELYVDQAIRAHNNRAKVKQHDRERLEDANTKWQDSYEQNLNPVLPVSSYGKSNIEEAFAEVFQAFVLGTADLSSDQVESFRSVLASLGVIEHYGMPIWESSAQD